MMQKSSEVVSNLESDSQNIGGVLDVIRGIAEQTNLLALNAAIEAARLANKVEALRWLLTKFAHWQAVLKNQLKK